MNTAIGKQIGSEPERFATKLSLAEHIGRQHIGSDGRARMVIVPSLAKRRLWRRDELEQAHRDLHV